MYRLILFTFLSITTIIGCTSTDDSSNEAVFVTKLGTDTLAIESFVKSEDGIIAKVILRSPSTSLKKYDLKLNETGGIEQLITTSYALEEGFLGSGKIDQTIQKVGDSLRIEVDRDGDVRTLMTNYESGVLPFIDMVHWPFELALNNAKAMGIDTVNQRLLSGSRTSNFVIASISSDSMTIRHPSRGVMGTHVSAAGDLTFLDAGLTTRKLKVYREPYQSADIDALGSFYASKDKAGNPFGELSGAVEATFIVHGTDFTVSYGSPKQRGRDLFGGIVPWGVRWRTGANRATHFYTSKKLRIGNLDVPAGEYTLFTIPEADGGTLIINKQTGQNGTSYDESRDLGRVPMQLSKQKNQIEDFTIVVDESDDNGVLRLMWGNTIFSIDFEIK